MGCLKHISMTLININLFHLEKVHHLPVYDPDWALKLGIKDGKKRKPVMKVNSVMGLLLAVEAGVGLAALPEYLVSNSNNIIKVLPNSEGPITEAHFVYPQSLKNTARITAFRNFLFSKIGDWKS